MNSFLSLLENKMNIIDLSYRKLKPKSILSILRSIDEKEKVTSLDLEENFLYTDGLYRLFSYLKDNYPNLTRLNLKSTSISSQELFIISSFLKDFKYLKVLDLGFNIIRKSSIFYLKPIFHQLEELNLSSNFMKSQGIYILSSSFSQMKQLKRLYLNNCRLFHSDIYSISENISHLKSLECLSLEGNYCNSTVFSYFLSELPKTKLKYLNVSNLSIFYLKTELFLNNLQYTSFLSSQL